ncbi:MAG: hypothetical protein ACX939_09045 [Hyphococcus sp.]
MSSLVVCVKTLLLVAFAAAAFFGLAMALGVDARVNGADECVAIPVQMCLFTIL